MARSDRGKLGTIRFHARGCATIRRSGIRSMILHSTGAGPRRSALRNQKAQVTEDNAPLRDRGNTWGGAQAQ
jgi:hypothetical protein